jgi:hypothetical protein
MAGRRGRAAAGPDTAGTPCGAGRGTSTHSSPGSARSRLGRAARLRPSSAWSGRPSGGGDGPQEETAADHRGRASHARHGAALGPPGRAGVGPGLRPAVAPRWVAGVAAGRAAPLGRLGAAPTPPRPRPPAPAVLCAGAPDRAPTASGTGQASRRVGHAGGRPGRAGAAWLAQPARLRRAEHPPHPAAWRRGRAPGPPAVPGRRRVAGAVGRGPLLRPLLLAPRARTPAPATARAHQRERLGPGVVAVDAGHGRGADRPWLDPARGLAVPRAAGAAASGRVSTPWGWASARGGGLRWRRAPARPASRGAARCSGPR